MLQCCPLLTVLEWISIYWFSRAGPGANVRIYYELTGGNAHDMFAGTRWTSVPLGVAFFPGERVRLPKSCVSFPQPLPPMRSAAVCAAWMGLTTDADGHTCSGRWYSSRSTRRADTSLPSSSPRRWRVTCVRCSARAVLHTVSFLVRRVMHNHPDTGFLCFDDTSASQQHTTYILCTHQPCPHSAILLPIIHLTAKGG